MVRIWNKKKNWLDMMKTSYWLKNQWIWKQFSLVLKIRCLIFFEQKLAILMIVARLNLVVALERKSVRFIPCPSYQFSAPHFWRALPNVPPVDLSKQSRNLSIFFSSCHTYYLICLILNIKKIKEILILQAAMFWPGFNSFTVAQYWLVSAK